MSEPPQRSVIAEPAARPAPPAPGSVWWYFGPAFVASVAYMDPGNFATNIEAGSRFGYRLLWVLLWSNAMAILIQYLSAKLGIATGRTLPQNCRQHFSRRLNLVLWVAAEVGAMATDLAEFLGAALGFYLLFHLPLFSAALLTGVCVFAILAIEQYGFRQLELVIMSFVGLIGLAYAVEIWLARPSWPDVVRGVILPQVDASSIYVAVGMLGATVMPHVVYLHSALVLPRRHNSSRLWLQRMELLDVLVAMNGAWLVNSAMVIMAAAAFFGHRLTVESFEQAHLTLQPLLGRLAADAFAVALLCSGLSSSTVGTLAGQVILEGFLDLRISLFLRRLITMIPALVVIALGLDPLRILIFSQVCLSFCLPFALLPLLWLTASRKVMGRLVNRPLTTVLAGLTTVVILTLNVLLLLGAFGVSF
jgi:manganese transport protein